MLLPGVRIQRVELDRLPPDAEPRLRAEAAKVRAKLDELGHPNVKIIVMREVPRDPAG
ncbi:hypothetical protein GCM10020218_103450 [Dactylosporangium vinaceum]